MRAVPDSLAERLLPVAAKIFAEQGFEGTRVEDLAAASGIARATLYYYFAGKADILSFLLTRFFDLVGQAVAEAAAGPGNARERMDRVIDAELQVIADNQAACQAVLPNFSRVQQVPALEATLSSSCLEPVARILEDGIREGAIVMPSEEIEATAVGLFGVVTMTTLHFLLRDDTIPVPAIRGSMSRLLDGIWEKKRRRALSAI
jgi:AcrR family transcriptional regulator